jgi:polar amino acid transport system substrate-binding protein
MPDEDREIRLQQEVSALAGLGVEASLSVPGALCRRPRREGDVSTVSADVLKDLAPTGTLRVAINLGNIVLAQGTPDAPRGVTPELARELGRRLGVPVALVGFDAAGKAFEALKARTVDVIFLAIEPVRAAEIEFTPPYVLIEGVYMVPRGSALKTPADVDTPGIRIGVNKASAYDLYLTRTLRHATLVRSEDGATTFVRDGLDAAGGVKQALMKFAAAHPDVRLIEERFMEIRQAMGVPKGHLAGAAYLTTFIEEMKASGFVADALRRSGQGDAAVAPPAG